MLQAGLEKIRSLGLPASLRGIFGPATAKAVRKFQANEMKGMAAMLSHWGMAAGEVIETGEVDRLTLLGLDAYAAAQEPHEEKPAPAAPKEEPAAAAEEAPADGDGDDGDDAAAPSAPGTSGLAQPPDAPPPKDWVFDLRTGKKKQSIKFGLRLYKALLRWELLDANNQEKTNPEACRYSCLFAINKPYKEKFEGLFKGHTPPVPAEAYFDGTGDEAAPKMSLWPRIDLTHPEIAGTTTVGKHKVYSAGRATWVAAGYANCSISQYAAVYAAAGGVKLAAKTDQGMTEYAFNGKDKNPLRQFTETDKNGKKKSVTASLAFEKAVMVGAGAVQDESGVPAQEFFSDKDAPAAFGGAVNAMRVLGLGDGVGDGRYTTDQGVLLQVRLGDWANLSHHSWLVGDVVYGLWLEGGGKKKPAKLYGPWAKGGADCPDLFIAQSSFALQTPAADGSVQRLGENEITWLESGKNDAVFLARVKGFIEQALSGSYLDKHVKKIEVVDVNVFSANGLNSTVFGKHYKDGVEDAKNNNGGLVDRMHRGVTRSWSGGVPDATTPEELKDGKKKSFKPKKYSGRIAGPGASYGRWFGPVES